LLTIIPAPYFRKHGKRPGIVAFVNGVTAAAVGAIAGAVLVLGRRTILDGGWSPGIPKLVMFAITLALLMRFSKLPEPIVVSGAGLIGLLVYPWVRG
jgi:chromate transporter